MLKNPWASSEKVADVSQSSLKVHSTQLTSCLIQFEIGSCLLVQLSSFKPRCSTLDRSHVFLFLHFEPFFFSLCCSDRWSYLTSHVLMSTFFMFLKDLLFKTKLFPYDKTISSMRTETCHFSFFYFSKKIALCTSLRTLQWTWTCERPAEEPRDPLTSFWPPAAATGLKHFHWNRATQTTEPGALWEVSL